MQNMNYSLHLVENHSITVCSVVFSHCRGLISSNNYQTVYCSCGVMSQTRFNAYMYTDALKDYHDFFARSTS